MVKLKTLNEVVHFINSKHSDISSVKGIRIYSSFRQPDGKKLIFSIVSGARITSFDSVGSDSLIVQQSMKGIFSKYNQTNVTQSLYLSDLRVVNIYEAFTEFLTVNKIDFMYVLPKGPTFTLLSALEMLPVPPLLAQWTFDDEKLEDSIDHLGKTVVKERVSPHVNLDLS